ncbi:MAG: hypothetical protein IPM95_00125 [Sphingobacteriales bacterium]|nr:hypothetical protein [Sphingobacteriales bacterium]
MGWWGFKDIWSDPKISEIRDNVLTGFSFAIGAGELKSGIEFWKVMGVLNDVDDLLKGSDNIKDKNLKKFVTSFKMVVDYKGLQNTSIESLTDKKISPTQAASLAFDAKGVLDSANLLKEQVDSKSTKKKSD